MAYDPNIGFTTSIIISGVDIRKSFGAEGTGNVGRFKLSYKRREFEYPTNSGVTSQGGTNSKYTIIISGWMPKSSIMAFKRFLSENLELTNKSAARKYIQFGDDVNRCYVFDMASDFEISPVSKGWMIDTTVNFSFEIDVIGSVSKDMVSTQYLSDGGLHWPGFELASPASPEFIVLKQSIDTYPSIFRDIRIRIGPSTDFTLNSATHSCVTSFDGVIKAVGVDGVVTSGINDGLYAPTNKLLGGYFEDGTIDAAWTTTNASKSIVGSVIDETVDGNSYRVLTGTQAMRVLTSAANGYVEQVFPVTSGVDYNVRVEIFKGSGAQPVKVQILSAAFVLKYTESTTLADKWNLVDYTFRADSTGNWLIRIIGVSNNSAFYVNRAVVAQSLLTNGSFDHGTVSTGWTVSGATLAQEPTIVANDASFGSFAGKITFNTINDYLRQLITTASNKVYYVSGSAYRVSGSGGLFLTGEGSVIDKTTLSSAHKLKTGAYVRFSCFFNVNATGGSVYLNIKTDIAGTVIIIDELSITELSLRTNDVFFEPGNFGYRLQIPVGEVAKITDFVNSKSLCAVAKYKPYLLTQMGSAMVFQIARDHTNNISLHQEYISAVDFSFGCTYAEDYNLAYYKSNGNVFSTVDTILDFGLSAYGHQSIAVDIDGTYENNTNIRTFSEKQNSIGASVAGEKLATMLPNASSLKNYNVLLFGDVGAFDAFWCVNHSLSDEEAISEMTSKDVPVNKNTKLTYSGALLSGNYALIDLKKSRFDVVTGVAISNGFANMSGDMPRFYGKKAVLYTNTGIKAFSVLGSSES